MSHFLQRNYMCSAIVEDEQLQCCTYVCIAVWIAVCIAVCIAAWSAVCLISPFLL